jgi:dUTP pyrophosphatase
MKSFNEELGKAIELKKQTIMELFTLPYKRFDKSLPALFKEDEGNAGFDLFARLSEPVTLQPGEVAVIPLNVATKIPRFAVGLLFQRSSTFRKWGVRLTNGVGVIDSLFSGNEDEWAAEFQNMTNQPITINHGDKVCQAVFLPLLPVVPKEYDVLDSKNRGGFGTSFDNATYLKGVVK